MQNSEGPGLGSRFEAESTEVEIGMDGGCELLITTKEERSPWNAFNCINLSTWLNR